MEVPLRRPSPLDSRDPSSVSDRRGTPRPTWVHPPTGTVPRVWEPPGTRPSVPMDRTTREPTSEGTPGSLTRVGRTGDEGSDERVDLHPPPLPTAVSTRSDYHYKRPSHPPLSDRPPPPQHESRPGELLESNVPGPTNSRRSSRCGGPWDTTPMVGTARWDETPGTHRSRPCLTHHYGRRRDPKYQTPRVLKGRVTRVLRLGPQRPSANELSQTLPKDLLPRSHGSESQTPRAADRLRTDGHNGVPQGATSRSQRSGHAILSGRIGRCRPSTPNSLPCRHRPCHPRLI